ncbi:multicopper oxidase domain-containing protein [Nocardiopsis sp. JB363]|uniref:multicopper oxidase domain-containing protein n=1 Tax=Nocardiopsis sp. JB363 TaxID=1434837 RepID=UPI00097AF21B|nr:multicopper oxidase domain-containing protein [Nocardiopsis sp. JB363]SIO88639.1 Multicopper oxidase [Nocardiopsis sp. JB363]
MPATFVRIERPDRPPPLPRQVSWHARANAIALVWALLAVCAAASAGPLGLPSWLPVHLFLLGTVTNAIITWTEHFTVALLRLPATSDRHQGVRLAVLNTGVVVLVVGATAALTPFAVVGAVALLGVVVVHTLALARASRGALAGRFAHIGAWYTAAGASFVLGAALGTMMLFDAAGPEVQQRSLAAHVHLNLWGWVGLAVIGSLFTLWPTILRTRIVEGAGMVARRALVPVLVGLVAGAVGLATGMRWVALAGIVVYAAGVLVCLVPLVRTGLRKRPTGAAAWSVAASLVWLLAALVVDVHTLAVHAPHEVHAVLQPLLPLFLVGFTGQVLLGSLTYLLPVVLGGGPRAVKANTALLGRGWPVRLATLNLGLPLTLAPDPWGTAAWALVLASAATFVLLAAVAVLRAWEVTASPGLVGTGLGAALTALALVFALGVPTDEESAVTPTGRTSTVDVALGDMVVEPGTVTVDPGDALVLEVTNEDAQPHDLRMENGTRTPVLAPGESATLEVGVVDGPLRGWCSVMGHRASGMEMTVTTTGDDLPLAEHGEDAGHGEHGTDSAGLTGERLDLSGEFTRGWEPVDAELDPAPDTDEHEVEIRVSESEQEVAPGVRRPVWTFGDTAPGPVLRGRVGDVFDVTLINDGTIGHSIDFHAGSLAPDEPMRTIAPGEELTYRFTADKAGAWLYHCSTAPMSHHLANGMYGAVIIDPPDLAEVDREYVLVQGELYPGEPGDAEQTARIHAGLPQGWMFNGAAMGYDHAPLAARVDERVRVWVVTAGPVGGTSFHVVGSRFDTVYKEGAYLLRPEDDGGSQTLDLGTAQGGFVETTFPEAGHYPFVDHDLRHAEGGAHGHFEVEEP